jgi:hypothetical protein
MISTILTLQKAKRHLFLMLAKSCTTAGHVPGNRLPRATSEKQFRASLVRMAKGKGSLAENRKEEIFAKKINALENSLVCAFREE